MSTLSEGQVQADKVREARLRCFGHVQRTDRGYVRQRLLKMEAGRRKSGTQVMQRVMNRMRWRQMIHSGNPKREQSKEEDT